MNTSRVMVTILFSAALPLVAADYSFSEEAAVECCAAPADPDSLSAKYDFFTNFGQYMARKNCLRTAEGGSDWTWVIALIVLNVVVVAAYVRIFLFWRRCYLDEQPQDRDVKLMELAWIFALCAICGYALATVIFFWPVYRLQAFFLTALAVISWRFALNLEPIRASLSSRRLQRELNEVLQRENVSLIDRQNELAALNGTLEHTTKELRDVNKNLDEFVYAASHDLKAPLRAIDNLSQFIIEDTKDELPDQARTDLLELRGRVLRMERLLDGLLVYSRSQSAEFPAESMNLRGVVQNAIDVLDIPEAFQIKNLVSGVQLKTQRPPFEQVIRNLIDNAIKHHDRSEGLVTISGKQLEGFVQIEIKDDGPGIPAEYHERIFEMFATIRRRDVLDSNGMGLSMVKRTIEKQGGEIEVESEVGQGTLFRFNWPTQPVANSVPIPLGLKVRTGLTSDQTVN